MRAIVTSYGYLIIKESDLFDIVIYNEDSKIVCALTKSDISKMQKLVKSVFND